MLDRHSIYTFPALGRVVVISSHSLSVYANQKTKVANELELERGRLKIRENRDTVTV